MATQGETKNEEEDLSADINKWTKHQVKQWALNLDGVDAKFADMLYQQDINGASLVLLDRADLMDSGVTLGPAKLIINARDKVMKLRKEQSTYGSNQIGRTCKPYPFHRYHDSYRYRENSILDVPESSALDFVEPCHEYKGFIHTPDENKMEKFTSEVIRFAAACMNSRTNGTIHFGIGDMPEFTHGQVLGVIVTDREAYGNALQRAVEGHFEHKHISAAKSCIKPPRFVTILNQDMTSSEKSVVEVDIVPSFIICEQNHYHILQSKKTKKKTKNKETDDIGEKPSKQFFVRDGSSSRDLLAPTTFAKPGKEYADFLEKLPQLSQLRQQEEEKQLKVVRSSVQGSRLSQMITGGSQSLDKSHFEQYVIVTNKSHPVQLESLGFLLELNPIAVLDFDPESADNGLQKHIGEQSTVSTHLPVDYKITEAIEDIAKKLKLTRNTSWVFCNGGLKNEAPSDIDSWLMGKGASVRDVISFLCRKEVLPQKRYLVIFLIFSTVSEKSDPLIETFSMFLQELKVTEQILCICENENAFNCWKDLIQARYTIDISHRCIYELSFAQVNGTICSLLSENRRACRFLSCGGGSKVLFEKKVEGSLSSLDVLCVNQCEGGSEDKVHIEENFYKGGKVSWWNLYFSEQPGSTPFIKRDKFDFIIDTVIPELNTSRKACVQFNLIHVPGCGGTTLAMHILWALKDKFRCAVLKDCNADLADVAQQVVKLLTFKEEKSPQIPVLLLIDDFDDINNVIDLKEHIEKECVRMDIKSRSPQVFLLNCMRTESVDQTETTVETVLIDNSLSEAEQRLFEQKLVEIEKTHKNAETFYGFMIMKKNFLPEYIQGVARNTLKGFDIHQKHAQLIAVLVLLEVHNKGASLSISLCEEFLGLQPKPCCGSGRIEDGFGKFSTLIARCVVEDKVRFEAMKIMHSSIALHCLQEINTTYQVKKADIANLLLNTDNFYECTQGKGKLMQDVRKMLVKRNHSIHEEDTQFSPLIQGIVGESQGLEEMVLQNAAKRFEKDSIICQLLARYYYLKRKDFEEAKQWALQAKRLSRENSYIADTSAQVMKHELKNAVLSQKEDSIKPSVLSSLLHMAQSATEGFQEVHQLARKESEHRFLHKTDNSPLNTSGCLGEIQVAVMVIEILKKTSIFSLGNVGHDLMGQLLSGKIKIQQLEKHDPRHNKHMAYYQVLREFEDFLYNLKTKTKRQIDFLENIYVNLGPRLGSRDSREQVARQELLRCFKQYVNLFCKIDCADLLKNKGLNFMLQVEKARQFLEARKADTHSGILNCLSNGTPPEMMEKIARQYDVILKNSEEVNVTDKINYIYVNVVLSRIKPQSRQYLQYQCIIDLLKKVLDGQIPLKDNLPLYFLAVALLWPQQSLISPENLRNVGKYVSQMRTLYSAAMKEVCNGKWPVVHFLMGKKQGYERLVHIANIENSASAGQEKISSLWENDKIWKVDGIEELLCRVTGKVKRSVILADTCVPDFKIEINPMFRSQLSGRENGSKVSFFIGFTIKGPFAIDIE